MSLFKKADIDKITAAAALSKEYAAPPKAQKARTMTTQLQTISEKVTEYFKDSPALLITTKAELKDYVDECISEGEYGIDTETTGLDRIHDTIVGTSLYCPGLPEVYIPHNHIVPIFEEPYPNQLSCKETGEELRRLNASKAKGIYANADFDLWFILKDLGADMMDSFYYDVITAWRCVKDNEPDNALKVLYNKYVLKGNGDPMKFSDFFSAALFPYCDPKVAKLYAANDAKITWELYRWQLPYLTKGHPKCEKKHLEAVADVFWNIEMPMVQVCQNLFRRGIHIDRNIADKLKDKYHAQYDEETAKLQTLVQELIDKGTYLSTAKPPFRTGKDFKESSPVHVKYLLYQMLGVPEGKNGGSTDKETLKAVNHPITNQILRVRSVDKLLNTYVDSLPKLIAKDRRIHPQFLSLGAATGRMSSRSPNAQNIPSHAEDVRRMFRSSVPRREEVVATENSANGQVTVCLNNYDSVFLSDGSAVLVNTLGVGQIIRVIDDNQTREMEICGVDEMDSKGQIKIRLQSLITT